MFIFPTRADNLPLVLQESMDYSTAMVSFNISGIPNLVRSGITGYLAHSENTQDFCDGIVKLLEDEPLRKKMSENCRDIALKEYNLDLQAQLYMELYKQVLK